YQNTVTKKLDYSNLKIYRQPIRNSRQSVSYFYCNVSIVNLSIPLWHLIVMNYKKDIHLRALRCLSLMDYSSIYVSCRSKMSVGSTLSPLTLSLTPNKYSW